MTGHSRSSRATLATLAALGLAAIVTATLTASGPVTWTTSTQAELLKGQSIGVAGEEIRRVVAAPAISVVHDGAAPQN